MVMTRTRIELACIRPGNVTENGVAASIKVDEGRLNLLETVTVQKAKGMFIITETLTVGNGNFFRNQTIAD